MIKNPFKKIKSDLIIHKDGHSYMRMTASFESVLYPVKIVPFYGTPQTVVLRKLSWAERRECGDFSLIETMADKIRGKIKKTTLRQRVEYAELQYELMKKSLVSPTLDEIMALNEFDILRIEAEKEMKSIEAAISTIPDGTLKQKAYDDYHILEMRTKFFLPADFMTAILDYALTIKESDLSDINSDDILYEAAVLAKNGNDNPHNHIPGNFKDHHLPDIDKRAWSVYYNRKKK